MIKHTTGFKINQPTEGVFPLHIAEDERLWGRASTPDQYPLLSAVVSVTMSDTNESPTNSEVIFRILVLI